MKRRSLMTVAIAIIAFWIVMTVLLLKREVFIPRLTPDRMAGSGYSDVPTDTWMAISLPDKTQIGFVNVRTEPETRESVPGTTIRVLGRVRLSMFGDISEMIAMGQTWISRTEGVRDFSFNIRSSGHEVDVNGAVEGGFLRAHIVTAGERYPIELPVDNSLRLTTSVGFNAVSFPALKPGDTFQIDTFDPLTLSASQAKISCTGTEMIEILGEQVESRVVIVDSNGVKTRAWISDSGEVLRAETPVGFIVERTNQEAAMGNLDTAPQSDTLGRLAAVSSSGLVPHRGVQRMTVRLRSEDPATPIPVDDTQVLDADGRLVIQVPSAASASAWPTVSDSPGDEYLQGDPFVQAGSTRIQEQSEYIVSGSLGDWDKAMKLYTWVYESIEKAPVLSVPSALDVLEKRRGDCNEHTVLYTALARAAGIPTRIAIGIVWSDEYDAFYYHAWPEIYVGRWVWIDPTLGQPIADATHIKLLTGGIENWWQLVPYLGKLRVEVEALD